MSRTITLKLNPDNVSIGFDGNKMCLKLSTKENNGLSFVDEKVVATKAPDGQGTVGTMNTSGNAIGPTDASDSDPLIKVGFNSTVTRHQKYTGDDTFLRANDGPVMTKNENGAMVENKSIASYMISYAGGGNT